MRKLKLISILGLCFAVPLDAVTIKTNNSVADKNSDRQALVGQYNLVGQMETASGLRLNADGSFDWYLIVGGLDLFAAGHWLIDDKIIVLQFDEVSSNAPVGAKAANKPIEQMKLRLEGNNLVPQDNLNGVYIRIKPRKIM